MDEWKEVPKRGKGRRRRLWPSANPPAAAGEAGEASDADADGETTPPDSRDSAGRREGGGSRLGFSVPIVQSACEPAASPSYANDPGSPTAGSPTSAGSGGFGNLSARFSETAPLPVWTSWAEEVDAEAAASSSSCKPLAPATAGLAIETPTADAEEDALVAVVEVGKDDAKRPKKKRPPPKSFLPSPQGGSSPQGAQSTPPTGTGEGHGGGGGAVPSKAAAAPENVGEGVASAAAAAAAMAELAAKSGVGGAHAEESEESALARVAGRGTCVIDMPAGAWGSASFASVVRGANAATGRAAAADAAAAVLAEGLVPDGGGDDDDAVPSPRNRRTSAGGASNASNDSAGRREKLLSPDRRTAEELQEAVLEKERRASAALEARALEAKLKIEKQREREAQVRARQEAMKNEKKVALEKKMVQSDKQKADELSKVVSRARKTTMKVEEIAFIKELNTTGLGAFGDGKTPVANPELKEQLDMKMSKAAVARAQLEAEQAARAEKAEKRSSDANERLNELLSHAQAKDQANVSKVDEAYERWTNFTASVAERAAMNARRRKEALAMREAAQLEEVSSKRRALEQRIAEANERRLAHIHMLMQQARVASERSAQAASTREARRTTWADESACSTTDGGTADGRRSDIGSGIGGGLDGGVGRDGEGGGGVSRGASRGGGGKHGKKAGKHGKHGGGRRGGGGNASLSGGSINDGCSTGDEGEVRRRWSGGGDTADFATDKEEEDDDEGGGGGGGEGGTVGADESSSGKGEERTSATADDGTVVAVPPTLAALEAAERTNSNGDLASSLNISGPGTNLESGGESGREPTPGVRSALASGPLSAQVKAREAERADAMREKIRKLRARAKKVRQRIAVTAAGLRLEHLEQLWGGGSSSANGSKRMLRLLAELSQLASQPQSDGAEATAWELCRLLEAGRERDLHTVRTQGGIENLLALACAGADAATVMATSPTVGGAGGGVWSASSVRISTHTAAVRALLAACALPQNRAYLLLTAAVERLAFVLLPVAVDQTEMAGHAEALAMSPGAPISTAPPDSLLLPLLKILRLVVATPPVAEVGRKLRADLVVLLLYSGGLHLLQEYAGRCAASLASAARHQPLLLQYFALLHALLLPVHADPQCSCAAALRQFLEESGLCGVPGMVTNILFEASHVAVGGDGGGGGGGAGGSGAPGAAAAAAGAVSGGGGGVVSFVQVSSGVIKVCRTAVQLLVHVGSLCAPEPGTATSGPNSGPGLLRRLLGGESLKIQTFHLSHLALTLWQAAERARPRGGAPASVPSTMPHSPALPGGAVVTLTSEEAAVCTELKSLMHETLLLLGLFSLNTPRNAEALRWRWSGHPTMLHRLCELPFGYYCEPRLRSVLFPTLLCACINEPVNLRILTSRLAPEHLIHFVRNAQAAMPTRQPGEAAAPPVLPANLIDDPSELPIVSMEYALAARLPVEMWKEAIGFFSARPESPLPDLGMEPPPAAARESPGPPQNE